MLWLVTLAWQAIRCSVQRRANGYVKGLNHGSQCYFRNVDSGRVVGKQEVTRDGFSHPLERRPTPTVPILKDAEAKHAKLQ
jgi:hypothetical protein